MYARKKTVSLAAAFDRLEVREVLSAAFSPASLFEHTLVPTVVQTLSETSNSVSSPAVTTVTNPTPLPANVSQDLNTLYQASVGGASTQQLPVQFPLLQFQGSSVAVQISTQGDFNSLVASLEEIGMSVTAQSAAYGIVYGYLPIAGLPAAAALPGAPSITASNRPFFRSTASVVPSAILTETGYTFTGQAAPVETDGVIRWSR